ncbi:hypothetical protein BJ998_000618 [Kutzneria kofuensis]|uniref:Uncharacterized protein n=1 Tax=Kutzneria kofuensis TaxID=103725 RepID=A0A7W9KBF1_9PSEU|nr:hypothetical protein [Kutzneria kofuensis]
MSRSKHEPRPDMPAPDLPIPYPRRPVQLGAPR